MNVPFAIWKQKILKGKKSINMHGYIIYEIKNYN